MKVKRLILELAQYDPDDIVVISVDPEGNNYRQVDDTSPQVFVSDGHVGEVYLRKLTPDLEKQGYSEEDLYHGNDGQNACVLWPE